MSITTSKLAETARYLRNAAPQQFNDFHDAFVLYTADTITNLVNASENLMVAQGQAQQCVKINKVLEEVRKNG